jgi:hypothetical protein
VKLADIFTALITCDTHSAVGTGNAPGFTASGTGDIADTLTLAPGDTVTYTVIATVSRTAPINFQLANTASITPSPDLIAPGNLVATDIDLIFADVNGDFKTFHKVG